MARNRRIMLSGIHFLLTYACTGECDHCFLYCSPSSPGTFTLDLLKRVFAQIRQVKSVASVYFEGGEPVIGGGVMFRGRAAEKLTAGLPTRPLAEFNSCPHEDLENPSRVHIDPYGHVHLCQGLLMGNIWQTPLSRLITEYNPQAHPLCGPLIAGGPWKLAQTYELSSADAYVDECHACYSLRLALLNRYPQHLAPRQVYGIA